MPKVNNIDDSPMIKHMESEESGNFFNSINDQTYNVRNSPTSHHPYLGEGVAVVEFPEENQQQNQQHQSRQNLNFDGLRLLPPPSPTTTTSTPTPTTTQKSIGKKAVQLSPINEETASSMNSDECNPRQDCCPLVDMSNRKGRGCTLGYKINQYNQQEGCVPESCRNKIPSEFMF
uniref:Uncharacterized protein n=1 Tax=Panagrolaimus superbus TaxID=310955 RepID=A0A914ZDP8_9BILA